MKNCPHCAGEFRFNVVGDRRTKFKYLRSGCCDLALRKCPDPEMLMRSPHVTDEQRNYLQRIALLDWFSGSVTAVLLEIEATVQQGDAAV